MPLAPMVPEGDGSLGVTFGDKAPGARNGRKQLLWPKSPILAHPTYTGRSTNRNPTLSTNLLPPRLVGVEAQQAAEQGCAGAMEKIES